MSEAHEPRRTWALLLEYDGTGISGWQRQSTPERPGPVSFQALLEAAAAHLARGAHVPVTAAGRTDAGVHAAGQVAMLTLPDRYRADQLREALNFHLRPYPFVVLHAAPAPTGWNPRFSARARAYEYRILNRRPRPAMERRVWHVERKLDLDAMREGASHLLGHHDFTSFRAASCQAKSPVRTLDRLEVSREGELVVLRVEARSFLHHQVRNMAGTLVLVGEGKWRPAQVARALEARTRAAAGPTAPPDGLTLIRVEYDPDPFTPIPAPTVAG